MESNTVVCGIDIGSWTFKISAYNGSRLDILTNEANFRETPSLVAYTDSERMVGESALIKMKSNFANSVRAPMRLIGLDKHFHLVEEELKYASVKSELNDELFFYVQYQSKKLRLRTEQILLTLFSKIQQIIESHELRAVGCYLVLPAYMSHHERKTVVKCGEAILKCNTVNLVDDWMALSAQYSYFRIKDLKNCPEPRNVVFVDIGYSKMSIYAVQFSTNSARIIDHEHLRFTGSRNMDHLVGQFYNEKFKQENHTEDSLFSNPKAFVKLFENIEKQRKVLSANSEFHMNIECILNDRDLSYTMKREEFEAIVSPIIGDISSAIDNFKRRIAHLVTIQVVEMIGGGSRIPLIRNMIANVFEIQPSKTLNASEALASGAAVYGSLDLKIISNFEYQIEDVNLATIGLCWHSVVDDEFVGENDKLYKEKAEMFPIGARLPNESVINFEEEGVVEMMAYYDKNIITKTIFYLRFKTPNKITFLLDCDKVLAVKLTSGQFLVCKSQDKKQERWKEMHKMEQQMQQNDNRITAIYESKNRLESMIYSLKQKLNSEEGKKFEFIEKRALQKFVAENEAWLESQNERKLGSIHDLCQYTQKIEDLNELTAKASKSKLRDIGLSQTQTSFRPTNASKMSDLDKAYQDFKYQVNRAYETTKSELKKGRLNILRQTVADSYESNRDPRWAGRLTFSDLEEAKKKIISILMEK